eukprot:scaffold8673_cov126-Cylindrotheca_fusiformis.AAC.5
MKSMRCGYVCGFVSSMIRAERSGCCCCLVIVVEKRPIDATHFPPQLFQEVLIQHKKGDS